MYPFHHATLPPCPMSIYSSHLPPISLTAILPSGAAVTLPRSPPSLFPSGSGCYVPRFPSSAPSIPCSLPCSPPSPPSLGQNLSSLEHWSMSHHIFGQDTARSRVSQLKVD
eukprot:838804-Rhodomonas_salina.2